MTGEFARQLEAAQPAAGRRRWLYVAQDQLSDGIGPLATEPPEALGIGLVDRALVARHQRRGDAADDHGDHQQVGRYRLAYPEGRKTHGAVPA